MFSFVRVYAFLFHDDVKRVCSVMYNADKKSGNKVLVYTAVKERKTHSFKSNDSKNVYSFFSIRMKIIINIF